MGGLGPASASAFGYGDGSVSDRQIQKQGQPSTGVSAFGHLDIPVNPFVGAEVGPYNALSRPQQMPGAGAGSGTGKGMVGIGAGAGGKHANRYARASTHAHGLGGDAVSHYFNNARVLAEESSCTADSYGRFARAQVRNNALYDYENNFYGNNVPGYVIAKAVEKVRLDPSLSETERKSRMMEVIRQHGGTQEPMWDVNTRAQEGPYANTGLGPLGRFPRNHADLYERQLYVPACALLSLSLSLSVPLFNCISLTLALTYTHLL